MLVLGVWKILSWPIRKQQRSTSGREGQQIELSVIGRLS